MSKILFENKKAALGFAGAIVVTAMVFSGVTGSSSDASESETSRLAQGSNDEESEADSNNEAQEEEEIAFADDAELVDDTGGFDPSPGEGSEEEEEGGSAPTDDPSDDSDNGDGGSQESDSPFDERGYPKFKEDF